MTKESRALKKQQQCQQIKKLPFRERFAAGVASDAPLAVGCCLAGLPLLSAAADSSGGCIAQWAPAAGRVACIAGPVPHSPRLRRFLRALAVGCQLAIPFR